MAKEKKINITLIPKTNADGTEAEPHALWGDVVAKWHPHLAEARVALLFRYGQKPNKDGHRKLGLMRKATDLDRELHDYDLAVVLDYLAWQSLSAAQRTALLDHEACHAVQDTDKEGEPKYDERGRPVWRLRQHDLEEFFAPVKRHGFYLRDIEEFARVCAQANPGLFDAQGGEDADGQQPEAGGTLPFAGRTGTGG